MAEVGGGGGGGEVTHRRIRLPKIPRPPQPKRPHHHQRNQKRHRRAHRRRHILCHERLPILQSPSTSPNPRIQREKPRHQRLRPKIYRPCEKHAQKLRRNIQPIPPHKHLKWRCIAKPWLEPVAPPPLLLLGCVWGRGGGREGFCCAVEREDVRFSGRVLFGDIAECWHVDCGEGDGRRAGCEVRQCLGFGDGGVGAAVEVEAWAGGGDGHRGGGRDDYGGAWSTGGSVEW